MRRSLISISLVVLLSFLALFSFLVYVLLASGEPQYWASEIAEFERRDVSNPPPKDAVLFIGGRDLRLWSTLASDMGRIRTINRGFGDAQIAHATYYIPRIVKPYRPRAIVLMAGEADLADVRGRRAEDVLADLKAFIARLRAEGIAAPVYFISIRPAPMRSSRWFGMRRANVLVEDYAKGTPDLRYIDAATPILDESGNARDELFRWDGLSLNEKGYAVLTARIRPILVEAGLDKAPAPPAPPATPPLPTSQTAPAVPAAPTPTVAVPQ
jgi:lysophospholipase L1-like esterase